MLPLLIGTALALLFVYLSVRASRTKRYLDDTPTSPAAGVFIGDVEVKGTAESDGPITSYLSEIACVHHAWRIEEGWRRLVTETYTDEKGRTRTRTRWESGSTVVASGGSQIPFYLKDASGVILIRPEGAQIEPEQTVCFECGPDHPSYYGKGPAEAIFDSTHRRTFIESAIRLHAPVFIAGRARERSDMVAAEVAHDDDARLFLISVRDEQAVRKGYGCAAAVWLFLGVVVMVAGFEISAELLALDESQRWIGGFGAAAAYLSILFLSWSWMAYNSIAMLRQRVRRAWSNIEVELKRRADLLPNLASVVKAAGMHDKDTQQVIAILRSQAAIPPELARSNDAKVQGVGRVLVAIAEAYPSISAQPNFLALQKELSNTETRIAMARSYYNGIATAFNARLLIVPDRFLAMIAGLRPFELFNATGLDRENPTVRFVQS
jgi:hypothetical protein